MLDLLLLAQQCAPQVHPDTIVKVIRTESTFNPFAIGVVDGALERQPSSLKEAMESVETLEKSGRNYSVGLMQVNKNNLARFGLTPETAFDTCKNLQAGASILQECFERASLQPSRKNNPQAALRDAFSCYYSGNFKTGYDTGYVEKVVTGTGRVRIGTQSRSARYGAGTDLVDRSMDPNQGVENSALAF